MGNFSSRDFELSGGRRRLRTLHAPHQVHDLSSALGFSTWPCSRASRPPLARLLWPRVREGHEHPLSTFTPGITPSPGPLSPAACRASRGLTCGARGAQPKPTAALPLPPRQLVNAVAGAGPEDQARRHPAHVPGAAHAAAGAGAQRSPWRRRPRSQQIPAPTEREPAEKKGNRV